MEHELVIGKYTLESLTNGMYASPLDLYREYIQNAVIAAKKSRADFDKVIEDYNNKWNTNKDKLSK